MRSNERQEKKEQWRDGGRQGRSNSGRNRGKMEKWGRNGACPQRTGSEGITHTSKRRFCFSSKK